MNKLNMNGLNMDKLKYIIKKLQNENEYINNQNCKEKYIKKKIDNIQRKNNLNNNHNNLNDNYINILKNRHNGPKRRLPTRIKK